MQKFSNEEKLKIVQRLRPIDDIFFEAIAEDPEVCEEILRVILEDPKLTVLEVITQSSEKNIYSRSVRLDALCTLGDGTKCNIEVQKSDNDDHLKRARFNASSITIKESNTGERFSDTIDLYIVYISQFDFLKEGRCIYHIDKVIRESGTTVDDGLHEIFVNTAVNDGSDISDLMSCFLATDVNNDKFPKLSCKVSVTVIVQDTEELKLRYPDVAENILKISEAGEAEVAFNDKELEIIKAEFDKTINEYKRADNTKRDRIKKELEYIRNPNRYIDVYNSYRDKSIAYPLAEYLDIKASQSGFDNYEDMLNEGLSIDYSGDYLKDSLIPTGKLK